MENLTFVQKILFLTLPTIIFCYLLIKLILWGRKRKYVKNNKGTIQIHDEKVRKSDIIEETDISSYH